MIEGSAEPYAGYLFAYFTGNTAEGERIRFAISDGNDALRWREVNGGRPVLVSALGTRGLRDPFLVRSPVDGDVHVLATDLAIGAHADTAGRPAVDTGGGASWAEAVRVGSRHIEVWSSRDLVSWSPQRHVLVSPASAGNTWAPEAIYDDAIGEYIVHWASALYDDDAADRSRPAHQRMMCATTRDFESFSAPRVWHDPGHPVIDATVIRHEDHVHRFIKDGDDSAGSNDIVHERSSGVTHPSDSWSLVESGIGGAARLGRVEGPIVVRSNPGDVNGECYYLFLDEFDGRGYVPLITADIDEPHWEIPAGHRVPPGARHGGILPITARELAALAAL